MSATRGLAIITGGNRGIGFETARQLFLTHNHDVVLAARDAEKAQQAVSKILSSSPSSSNTLSPATLDVASETSIHNFISTVLTPAITTDPTRFIILINNAGIYKENWTRTRPTNVVGPLLLSRGFMNAMTQRKQQHGAAAVGGRIVNLTSGLGNAGCVPDSTLKKIEAKGFKVPEDVLSVEYESGEAYNLSKHLVNYMTGLFAGEGEGVGVSVSAVDPGWVKTDMGGPSAPRSIAEGADTVVWLASEGEGLEKSGKTYRNRQEYQWKR
ncbi:hypothetical protein HK104_002279 [Borealophlyctis nickersoniae]|nr:hypothetical protein HK104_002279 [Borealophlyctis nickersoniae]